ncbi:hypothetical protein A0257_10525 [Hymenobacter psoromatis]|nr:hypothetical protein A0257_10525 [Hymenobacter psoromatis]
MGRPAGLGEAAIQALVAGEKPAGLWAEEGVAHEFTHQLCRLRTTHQIDAALHKQALATFGEKGVVDMIYLAGQYMIISGLLHTFAMPAPEAG